MNSYNKIFRYFYTVMIAVTACFQVQAMSRPELVLTSNAVLQSQGTISVTEDSKAPCNECNRDKESKTSVPLQVAIKSAPSHATAEASDRKDASASSSIKHIIEAYTLVDGDVIDFIDERARGMFDCATENNKKTAPCCAEAVIEKSDMSEGTKFCTPSASDDKESKDSTKSSPDLEKLSINELNKLVATGNADAMNELGQRFEVGNGVAKNENMAITYYIVAACELKPASPRAMCNLARCVIDGKGNLRVSIAPALDLLQYASQLGDVDAKVMLAYCRCNFFGIYDLSEASVRKVMKEANDFAAEAARLKGESYVNALSAKLKQDHFGFHLQKCAYCSEDFINLNGTKRNDVVELQNESVAHRHCCEANQA